MWRWPSTPWRRQCEPRCRRCEAIPVNPASAAWRRTSAESWQRRWKQPNPLPPAARSTDRVEHDVDRHAQATPIRTGVARSPIAQAHRAPTPGSRRAQTPIENQAIIAAARGVSAAVKLWCSNSSRASGSATRNRPAEAGMPANNTSRSPSDRSLPTRPSVPGSVSSQERKITVATPTPNSPSGMRVVLVAATSGRTRAGSRRPTRKALLACTTSGGRTA